MFVIGSVLCSAAAVVSETGVMNAGGIPYKISNPPGSTSDWVGTPGNYSTDFLHNVEGEVEYFDVYGEVRTQYSQVYWTRNTPINLPDALVKRFAGKVMAITGYEVDQVTHSGPQTGTTTKGDVLGGFACYPDCSEGDKSVPSYNAYNHHYFGWLQGADSEMYDLDEPQGNVPNPTTTAFRDLPSAKLHGYPTNIVFKENPGGEYRKSYHGYPSGYAQLLHSPTTWVVEPMQIDTHNREYDINDDTIGYQPSFLPTMVENNMTMLNGGLSPLIECPCTTRITRTVVNSSAIIITGTCPQAVDSLDDCKAAAADMGATVVSSASISNASLASGCILQPTDGGYSVAFNTASSSATCDSEGSTLVGPFNNSVINEGVLPPDPSYGCTGEFPDQCTWDSPQQALEECGKADACRAFFCSTQPYVGKKDPDKLLCFGRASTNTEPSTGGSPQSWVKQDPNSRDMAASAYLGSLVNFSLTHNGTSANITMTGPDGVWYGVGFDATRMSDLPYAIIVDGSGNAQERKLANHGPGDVLSPSVTVVSNTVTGSERTVILSRPVAALTADHYAIPTSPGGINVIVAVGNTHDLAYHAHRTGAQLNLLPSKVPSCICEPQSTTYLTYMNTTTSKFAVNCVDEPRSDMLRHGDTTGRELPNAACHMQTYNGGLQCCAHKNFLTDLEQDSLIPNKTDTYFLKWRYYFQEYVPANPANNTPASHLSLYHWVFLIDDAVNDYEEDNAHYGQASMGRITAHLNVDTMGIENRPTEATNVTFLVMTPHCHAPSCIREEIWNADTGEILCNVSAEYGRPEYGSLNEVFNEKDYVAIPPCIFGDQAGLQTPWTLPFGTNITAIKYLNNTYRHLGQMAQWTGLIHYPGDAY